MAVGQDFAVPAGDARAMDASSVMVWYDPRSRNGSANDPNNGTFLPVDIALAGLARRPNCSAATPSRASASCSPPVAGLVPVTIGGYGTSGNGFTGARTEASRPPISAASGRTCSASRRRADHRAGHLSIRLPPPTSSQDPAYSYQDLYWMDFDDDPVLHSLYGNAAATLPP